MYSRFASLPWAAMKYWYASFMLQASTPWPVLISSPKAAMRSRHSSTLTAPASSAAIARMRSSAACWRTISAYSRQLALVGVISISWISRASMP